MKSSELILNEDGSLYHLALKPGEVGNIIITVGDPERVARVSSFFDTIQVRRSKREFVTHTGTFKTKRITVLSTGIGTDNIDIVFNELHSLRQMEGLGHKPLKFIRLGTSGSIRREVEVDTLLISKMAIGFDGLLHFYEWNWGADNIEKLLNLSENLRLLPKPYAAPAGEHLFEKCKTLADQAGVTVTAPGFYAPQGRSVNLPAKVKNFVEVIGKLDVNGIPITNIEMETAGIYGLAHLLGHQAISLSAILANRATGIFSADPSKIVDKLIVRTLELIARDPYF